MPGIELLVRYKILLLLLLSNLLYGQNHPDKSIDSLLSDGIQNIVVQDYDSAFNVFIKLDQQFNTLPLGQIYLAATEIAKSVDYMEDINVEYVDSLLELASDKTELLLEANPDDLWNNYYEALIFGYKAYYYSISGSLIAAFSDGVQCLRSFHKCLEIDPNFYEAYTAMGTYNYWKSARSKAFLWLPFVADNREEGIKYLERAVESSTYNKHLAAYSLVWIYIDYGENQKAIDLSIKSLQEFQDSRFFKWGLARAYKAIDKNKTIDVYYDLLRSVETLENSNLFNNVVLMHKIAMLYDEIGDYSKSLKLCNEILAFDIKSDKIRQRLVERIKRVRELKESLIKKLDK